MNNAVPIIRRIG